MLFHFSDLLSYGECTINTEAARNTQTVGGKPIDSSEILASSLNIEIVH